VIVVCDPKGLKKYHKPVVALGVFDGVHRAHRLILREVAVHAHRIKGTSMVVTFFPHPQRKESLYSLEHRLRLISQLGIDVCIVIKFNRQFSQISAEDFIKKFIVDKLEASYIYVGRDFRFGRKAEGNVKTLKKLSGVYSFKIRVFDIINQGGRPISSTTIRGLVTAGKLVSARNLLSRPVSVLGTVIKGAYLASKLGFPTANINPHHEVLPPSGVYAVKVNFNKRKLNGICYIGTRPTFRKQLKGRYKNEKRVEVHIFNFKENIYGKDIEIEFIKVLRREMVFSSLRSLVSQVKKDIISAKKVLFLHPHAPQYMPV